MGNRFECVELFGFVGCEWECGGECEEEETEGVEEVEVGVWGDVKGLWEGY